MLRARLVSWISVLALATLGILSAGLSIATAPGSGSGQNPDNPNIPAIDTSEVGFAGYNVEESVTEVSAEITVPSISSVPARSSFGTASTWIGAQNPGGWFAQIGVTETGYGPTDSAGTQPPAYEAFWSDTARGFHPVSIAPVETGDHIALEMNLQSSGWVLQVRDLRFGWVHEVVTDYGAGQAFNDGSWIQEDPIATAHPLQNLPYPEMSQTVFSDVEVDGATPAIHRDDAQTMDVPGGPFLAPGGYSEGGFKVNPVTGFARQYLADLAPYNLAEDQFAFTLGHSRPENTGPIVAASGRLVSALDSSEETLSSQTWPAGVQVSVEALVSRDYLLSEDLRFIAYGDFDPSRLERVFNDQDATEGLSARVRAELGLPPP